jgi:DNA-binding MarR family transcriptional regulator
VTSSVNQSCYYQELKKPGVIVNTEEVRNILWENTRIIKDNTNKAFSPLCEKYGLTMMQGRIITELHHYGPKSIGNLAESVAVAGANLSAMCKRMEDQGLVVRRRDPSDERMVMVDLTEYGRSIADDIDKTLMMKLQKILEESDIGVINDIVKGMVLLNELLTRISETKINEHHI